MKTISDYTIYCTEAQTRKALELGAPIETIRLQTGENPPIGSIYIPQQFEYYYIPTAEQMIGFIEDATGLEINIIHVLNSSYDYFIYKGLNQVLSHGTTFNSRKEATLAAIDAALEYLINNSKR